MKPHLDAIIAALDEPKTPNQRKEGDCDEPLRQLPEMRTGEPIPQGSSLVCELRSSITMPGSVSAGPELAPTLPQPKKIWRLLDNRDGHKEGDQSRTPNMGWFVISDKNYTLRRRRESVYTAEQVQELLEALDTARLEALGNKAAADWRMNWRKSYSYPKPN